MLENPNILNMVCTVEPLLWFMVLYSYSRSTVESRSRCFRLYLALQMAIASVLAPLVLLMLGTDGTTAMRLSQIHSQIYWWGSILSGILVIGTIRDVLSQILSSLVGLQRLALLSLQWLLIVISFILINCVLRGLGRVSFSTQLARISYGLTIAQILLLLLVVPFTFVVRRSMRSRYQDVMLGLAVLAMSNAILNWGSWSSRPMPSLVLMTQVLVVLTTLVFWTCCFIGEERISPPRMLPANSRLVRWSEKFRVLKRAPVQAGRGR